MKLNKMLTMSRRFLYLILGVAALFVLTVVGLISYVGFNIATESEGLLIGGLGGRAGEYFGQSSLEERIAGADVIARVRLRSVSSAVEQLARKDGYYGALEHHFQVLEYMHGRGSGKLVAVAYDPGTKHTTARAASARGNALRDNRDTRWDNREAIIFLTDAHPELPSSNQEGRYWFGTVSLYTGEEYYTIASRSEKRWLPAASAGEALGASGTSGGGQHFLLDAPAAPIGASGAAGQSGSAPTITLADMKAKIAANDREVAAGGGSEAYKECFYLKLKWEREVSYRKERLKGTFEDGRDYYYKLHSHTIRSGLPAGTLVYTAVQADRMLQFYGETEPSDYGEFVLRGMDEDLFHPQWPGVAKTSRPLPAEQYRFYYAYRHQEHVICDSLPEDELKRQEVFVTVRAPTGTLHEAFFDPVAIGPAVGADGTNGALTPTTFTVGRVRTSLQSLKWQDGSVMLELSTAVALTGYVLDFIALDGTVALSLDGGVATVSGGTLSRSVASQPWQAGDQLMLRIRKGSAAPTPKPTVNTAPAFDPGSYSFSVAENAAVEAAVGTVAATDPDEGDTVTYSITAGNDTGKFAIGSSSGQVTVASTLNYESVSSYTLTVEASDGNGGKDGASVTIKVVDVVEC